MPHFIVPPRGTAPALAVDLSSLTRDDAIALASIAAAAISQLVIRYDNARDAMRAAGKGTGWEAENRAAAETAGRLFHQARLLEQAAERRAREAGRIEAQARRDMAA